MTNGVFSEYELKEMSIKILSGMQQTYKSANCVGSCEETMNSKVVTKKCRGVVVKTMVRGDGTGTLNISMHIPRDIYLAAYGMELEGLIAGVKAYGQNSRHPGIAITQHVYDEDGTELYKAYPNCIIQSGTSVSIENGADEVQEISLEVSVMPDEYGNGKYEALAEDLPESGTLTAKTWMTAFTSEAAQEVTA